VHVGGAQPDPETPVTTVRAFLGTSTETSRRLFVAAPTTRITPAGAGVIRCEPLTP